VNSTLERATILTRSLMIYSQGAIRCHPYVLDEIEATNNPDRDQALAAFDDILYAHIGHDLAAAARSLVMGFTGARGTATGKIEALAPYYRAMNRYSANLALLSDIAMATLGADLKFRESLSARLGDVLSNLYIASATLKRFVEDGAHAEDRALVQWVCEDAFATIEARLAGVIRHLPNRPVAWLAGVLIFPRGLHARVPGDALGQRIAQLLQTPGPARDRLTPRCHIAHNADNGIALFERAMQATLDCAGLIEAIARARKDGRITTDDPREQIEAAVAAGVFDSADADRMHKCHALRMAVIEVDDFDINEMQSAH
jgi:acyl-CoA dehydrogenase